MGPSETSPASVVYLLSSRRVVTVPHVRVWEDQFPGVKGDSYSWFPPEIRDAPVDNAVDSTAPPNTASPATPSATSDVPDSAPSAPPLTQAPPSPSPPPSRSSG